ncbi:hypothetical protein P1J78_18160 [Psychromarinibacter sp. C21-152]|uniref:Uncharacterized protein n=1 Tax=Psychromarinibacter sediminicola TaxID=3033385 RepID=A0AAE3NV40_9RHOB|nr:hypothetical protein [Psychromarinibacter sediminicola]MDF0602667.1 hypothetical protein [Psychromarinibacter sediminicola]
MRFFLPAALAALLAPLAPAHADETWRADTGMIAYLAEEEGYAIFSFTTDQGYPAKLYIPGLAGNYDSRGTHDAFWIGEGAATCPADLGYGEAITGNWGQARLLFDEPAFPTSFTLLMGDCFGALDRAVRAETTYYD